MFNIMAVICLVMTLGGGAVTVYQVREAEIARGEPVFIQNCYMIDTLKPGQVCK